MIGLLCALGIGLVVLICLINALGTFSKAICRVVGLPLWIPATLALIVGCYLIMPDANWLGDPDYIPMAAGDICDGLKPILLAAFIIGMLCFMLADEYKIKR